MKIPCSTRRSQDGSAVIVVIALLAIILIYVGSNLRTLNRLGYEINRVERHQIRRLQTLATNSTATFELQSPKPTERTGPEPAPSSNP
jgi:hypothetical protein